MSKLIACAAVRLSLRRIAIVLMIATAVLSTARASVAQLAPLGEEIVFDSGVPSNVCPSLAARDDGSALLLWVRNLSGFRTQLAARALASDGVLGPLVLVQDAFEVSFRPSVAAAGDGYAAVWRFDDHRGSVVRWPHYAARLDLMGSPSRARRLGHAEELVSPRPTGGFVVVGKMGRALTVRLLDDFGRAVSPYREIARGKNVFPQGIFHLGDGGFVVSWTSGGRGFIGLVGRAASVPRASRRGAKRG